MRKFLTVLAALGENLITLEQARHVEKGVSDAAFLGWDVKLNVLIESPPFILGPSRRSRQSRFRCIDRQRNQDSHVIRLHRILTYESLRR